MIPRYWICIKIPTAGMGKTDRKLLKSLGEKHNFRKSSKKINQTFDESHRVVRAAWSKVLKLGEEEFDDGDGFTRLGGDSIGFMKVISLLRVAGFKITFADLVSATTLSDCAQVLASSADSTPLTPKIQPFSLIAPERLPRILSELAADYSIKGEDIEDLFATSPTQDSLIAASIDSTHYFAQAVYDIEPTISTSSLVGALKKLCERHAVLRTVFVLLDESIETIQVVLKNSSLQVKQAATVVIEEYETDSEMSEAIKVS